MKPSGPRRIRHVPVVDTDPLRRRPSSRARMVTIDVQSASTTAPTASDLLATAAVRRVSPEATPATKSGGPSDRPVSAIRPDVAAARHSATGSSTGESPTTRGYAAPITAPSPDVPSASTVNELLAAARAGTGEITGALDGEPLLVVEAGAGSGVTEDVPVWLPCVVVALADAPPAGAPPAAADIALCPRHTGDAPQGWVAVEDPGAELARVRDQVLASPLAAVLFAQVLRAGEGLDVDAGLVLESLAYSTLQRGPAFTDWLARRPETAPDVRAEPDEAVLVERRDDVLVVTLNRPHVRNAVDVRLRDGLAAALSLACADPSIAEVELRGAGSDFSSGGDLDTFGTLPDPATAHVVRTARSPARLLAHLAARVTAHLHGACVGAGIELAAFAARVVAAPDTSCRLPEVSLGLVPGSGGTVSIPRRIGRQRTAWLGISGAVLEAERAATWGLVDEISRQSS